MPDLNTVPPSPHALATSRRQSQQNSNAQEPPSPSLNILPSNQSAVNPTGRTTDGPSLPPVAQQQTMASEESIVGSGPGPLRHPRPLTASELHIQLEKEQEALVRHSLKPSEMFLTNLTGQPLDSGTVYPSSRPQCFCSVQRIISLAGYIRHPRAPA